MLNACTFNHNNVRCLAQNSQPQQDLHASDKQIIHSSRIMPFLYKKDCRKAVIMGY